jgi:hypothetical protein
VRALTDDAHRALLVAAGRRAVDRWTWSNVATATVDALAAMAPRWAQRPRRPAERAAVAGVFGVGHDGVASTAAIAATNEQLVDALRASGTDCIALVDNAGRSEPAATSKRWRLPDRSSSGPTRPPNSSEGLPIDRARFSSSRLTPTAAPIPRRLHLPSPRGWPKSTIWTPRPSGATRHR